VSGLIALSVRQRSSVRLTSKTVHVSSSCVWALFSEKLRGHPERGSRSTHVLFLGEPKVGDLCSESIVDENILSLEVS
jgi:hypothetical protein